MTEGDGAAAKRRDVAALLVATRARLDALGEDAAVEAELLLVLASGRPRTALRAWPEASLEPAVLERLDALVTRRLAGEPYAYLVGRREFFGLELEVGPAVLVPRPDTETLVERALGRLDDADAGVVVDAGTGSGAVAVAIAAGLGPASRRPIVATERSPDALALARRNALRHLRPGRIDFVRADWLAPFAEASVALLVSNPPYLAENDPHLDALGAEPVEALVAGSEGLDAIERLVDEAARVLVPGGRAMLEHGATQGAAVRALFAARGFAEVLTVTDLAGHERVTEGRRPRPRGGLSRAARPPRASRSAPAAR